MEHGVIKFVDSDGFTRPLVVPKNSEDPAAISFSDLAKYVRSVFELQESTEVRIKYKKNGDEVVVEDERGWQATCYSLSDREALAVDVQTKLPARPDTRKVVWQQLTIAPGSSPVSGSSPVPGSSPVSGSSPVAGSSFVWIGLIQIWIGLLNIWTDLPTRWIGLTQLWIGLIQLYIAYFIAV